MLIKGKKLLLTSYHQDCNYGLGIFSCCKEEKLTLQLAELFFHDFWFVKVGSESKQHVFVAGYKFLQTDKDNFYPDTQRKLLGFVLS